MGTWEQMRAMELEKKAKKEKEDEHGALRRQHFEEPERLRNGAR